MCLALLKLKFDMNYYKKYFILIFNDVVNGI